MKTSNPLRTTYDDIVGINQKMYFLSTVLFHSKNMDAIQNFDCLRALAGFLDDMVVGMDDVVASLKKQINKSELARTERLERFLDGLARQMEEGQEDWDFKIVASNIRQVLNS